MDRIKRLIYLWLWHYDVRLYRAAIFSLLVKRWQRWHRCRSCARDRMLPFTTSLMDSVSNITQTTRTHSTPLSRINWLISFNSKVCRFVTTTTRRPADSPSHISVIKFIPTFLYFVNLWIGCTIVSFHLAIIFCPWSSMRRFYVHYLVPDKRHGYRNRPNKIGPTLGIRNRWHLFGTRTNFLIAIETNNFVKNNSIARSFCSSGKCTQYTPIPPVLSKN